MTETPSNELRERAEDLRLYGLLSEWAALGREPWVPHLLELEERERARRNCEYRIRRSMIGPFKAMVDFDWKHPTKLDRELVEELFTLDFVNEGSNVILLGPNGVGKTMVAQNLAYEAARNRYSVRYTSASDMLNQLAGLDGMALRMRLKHFVTPRLLVIDEVGYLRYDDRHADLLYEVVRQRYERKRSIIVTTNKPFAEWNTVFESAACLVTLIDRLCHRAEIVEIQGGSYRVRESKARSASRRKLRREKS